MIKINLLPVRDEKYVASAKGFIIISAILITMVIVTIVANNSVLTKREAESVARIDEADKEIANLKAIIGKINALKEKKQKLQEKINMIIKLQEENVGPVRVLDEMSLKLPSNKVWIESINIVGSKMSILGKSLENQEVANFMKQMETSMFFNKIELRRVQKSETVNGVPLLSFSLESDIFLAGKKTAETENKEKAGSANN